MPTYGNRSRRAPLRRAALGLGSLAFALLALALPGRPSHAQAPPDEGKIIVSGASGHLGGLTVEALLKLGVPASRLILVSRTPEKLADYAAGGTQMLLISVGGTKAEPAPVLLKRAIDAAKADGVKHIAYTSYVGITRGDTEGLAANHQQTEDILKASGVAWTMLRNSIYMDGLVRQADRRFVPRK